MEMLLNVTNYLTDLILESSYNFIISIGKIAEESPDEVKTSHVNLE